jgi:hypothetical protein
VKQNRIFHRLDGTHQLLANADDVNILGGIVHAVRENAEALLVDTKKIGLEVNTDKYMVMSRDWNAGRGHGVKIDNSSIERVEEFKYLGATLTDRNSIQEEIKSRLKLGNACCYSVQNLLCSRLLSRNLTLSARHNFQNFSTPCILNVNNTGAKQRSIMK